MSNVSVIRIFCQMFGFPKKTVFNRKSGFVSWVEEVQKFKFKILLIMQFCLNEMISARK